MSYNIDESEDTNGDSDTVLVHGHYLICKVNN